MDQSPVPQPPEQQPQAAAPTPPIVTQPAPVAPPVAAPARPTAIPFDWISLGLGGFSILVIILLVAVGANEWLYLIPLLIGAGGLATGILALKQRFQSIIGLIGLILGIILTYQSLAGIVAGVALHARLGY